MTTTPTPPHRPSAALDALKEALSEVQSRDVAATAAALDAGREIFPNAPLSLMDVYALEDNALYGWQERLQTGAPLGVEEVEALLADVGAAWMAVAAMAVGQAKG